MILIADIKVSTLDLLTEKEQKNIFGGDSGSSQAFSNIGSQLALVATTNQNVINSVSSQLASLTRR